MKKWKTQIIFGSCVIGLLFLIFVPMILMNQHSTSLIQSNSNKLNDLRRDFHFLKPDCPSGWQNITGNCYFFSDEKFTFSKAKDFCREKGARIFEPRDQHVSDMVFALADNTRLYYWIGIYSSSSTWKWLSDNSSVSWNNWVLEDDGPGQASYRYCVHTQFNPLYDISNGKWVASSQYACENVHANVICERMFT